MSVLKLWSLQVLHWSHVGRGRGGSVWNFVILQSLLGIYMEYIMLEPPGYILEY